MKKAILWLLTVSLIIGMVSVFSLAGCKAEEEAAPPEEEAAPAEEEAAPAEEEAEEGKPINIGVLATLLGAFAQLGEDSVDGVKLAFEEVNYTIAGRPVKLFVEETDATPDMAVDRMRSAVTRNGCQIVLGPLSGAEGLAIKTSADEWPDTTIIVSASASEDITMRGIKPNVWRSSFTGGQPMFPFGVWMYEQGYKRIVTIGEDYEYPYSQVGGLLKIFTESGGEVAEKYWVPIGTSDYSSIIADIPRDIDAIFTTLSGSDIVNFLTQMEKFGLSAGIPILGGTTSLDAGTVTTLGESLDGVVSGSIWTDKIDRPGFKSLYERYYTLRKRPPGLFTGLYYRSAQFAIKAIEAVNGNVEDQEAFRAALQETAFEGAVSYVSFDEYHQCIMDVFINQVKFIDGEWINVPIKIYPQVSQFWTYDPEEYQKGPSFTRESIDILFPSTSK